MTTRLKPGMVKTAIVCTLCVIAAPAIAQPVLYVDADAPPGGNGQSWITAYDDLQAALDHAAGDPEVEELWMADGIYFPDRGTGDPTISFVVRPALDLYGGFAGHETKREQRDPAANVVVLSGAIDPGNNVHSLQVVVVSRGADNDTTLDGLVITQGRAIGTREEGTDSGGGLYAADASPTVRNCFFVENTARRIGGGAWAGGSGRTPLFIECEFVGNRTSEEGVLGGAYAGGGRLVGCSFRYNVASRGAAIYCDSSLVVESCVFTNNFASSWGGAINVQHNSALSVVDSRFEFNRAALRGGAISITGRQTTIEGCMFIGNESDEDGGAMHFVDFQPNQSTPMEVFACSFRGNRSARDGGACFAADPAPLRFLHCDFIGNTAGRDGGALAGLAIAGHGTTLTAWNSTLAANSAAGRGGALYVRGTRATATVENSILWGNSDSTGDGEDAQAASIGAVLNFNCCDVQGWTGAMGGIGNFGADPLFIDLAGPDQMLGTIDDNPRYGPGSPCIDAGDNDVLPPYILTDVDSNPRYMDDPNTPDTGQGTAPVIDLGPFEVRGRIFVMQPPVPGVAGRLNVFAVRGAPPHTTVHFLAGFRSGRTRVPGCPPGVVLGIHSPQILGSAFVSIRGNADIGVHVPALGSGRTVLLQAVQVESCVLSDVLEFTFE